MNHCFLPLNLLLQTIFIENMIFATFLGMCTYLACSTRMTTAKGLGKAVFFILLASGSLNWIVHHYITKPAALSWFPFFDLKEVNLHFLELLFYIAVIAGFVQITELLIERFSPILYASLGLYLPLITVNCAILGASLFATTKELSFSLNCIYLIGAALGWWLAILLLAAIREKIAYSDIPAPLKGTAIAFIITGLMAQAFMGFGGIRLPGCE